MNNYINFIGLGKLGLCLCTNLGDNKNNLKILAIDKNTNVIDNLNNGVAPFYEPNLQENIEQSRENIIYQSTYQGVENAYATIILVNTPSVEHDGSFSNQYIVDSLTEICNKFKTNKKEVSDYIHTFIISSTVMPESIMAEFVPLIESITGWVLNKQFGICYVPDFVALGNVIADFHNPDFLLVGYSSDIAKHVALNIFKRGLHDPTYTKVCLMSIESAELAKISLNAYICMKISFANYLGMLSEKLNNVNIDQVTSCIGLDKRIGTKYFKYGLPFGGTCFPRDTWAFKSLSEKKNMTADHIIAANNININIKNKILKEIKKELKSPNYKLGIVGVGFKPNTPVITESMAEHIIREFEAYDINLYDNIAEACRAAKIRKNIRVCLSIEDILSNSDIIILNNPKLISANIFVKSQLLNTNKVIIDPWREYRNYII